MRLGIGIDRTPDLGHPELDAPVGELGEDVLHLTGRTEGPLGFTNDDSGPAAIRVGELGNKASGLGAPGPGDRTRDVGVVDNRDDLSAPDDEGVGPGKLPAQTFARVLLVVGGCSGVSGERNERLPRSCGSLGLFGPPSECGPDQRGQGDGQVGRHDRWGSGFKGNLPLVAHRVRPHEPERVFGGYPCPVPEVGDGME